MKPSLCIDARMLFSTGIGTYLRSFVPLIEPSFETVLLVKKKDEPEAQKRFSSRIRVFDAPVYGVREQLLYPYVVPACDLFWSPHYNVPLLPLRARRRAVTVHDLCHLSPEAEVPLYKKKGALALLKAAVRKSDLILTVSRFSADEMVRHLAVAPSDIHIIPNGVGVPPRSASSSSTSGPFILYVGTLKPHKNIPRMLQAFLRLPPRYRMVIVSSQQGNFPPHPRIERRGRVSETELFSLYREAELLIQPSLYEGFGIPPLEAMSVGCPVVSSRAASLPEVCGEAAYFVDPYSQESIYLGMKEVLESADLRRRLVSAGYERIGLFPREKGAFAMQQLFLREAER